MALNTFKKIYILKTNSYKYYKDGFYKGWGHGTR